MFAIVAKPLKLDPDITTVYVPGTVGLDHEIIRDASSNVKKLEFKPAGFV